MRISIKVVFYVSIGVLQGCSRITAPNWDEQADRILARIVMHMHESQMDDPVVCDSSTTADALTELSRRSIDAHAYVSSDEWALVILKANAEEVSMVLGCDEYRGGLASSRVYVAAIVQHNSSYGVLIAFGDAETQVLPVGGGVKEARAMATRVLGRYKSYDGHRLLESRRLADEWDEWRDGAAVYDLWSDGRLVAQREDVSGTHVSYQYAGDELVGRSITGSSGSKQQKIACDAYGVIVQVE